MPLDTEKKVSSLRLENFLGVRQISHSFLTLKLDRSEVTGIYVKFYHGHSPNMVMSRDPGSKFRTFLSFA